MRVCDKCKKREVEKIIEVEGSKKIELCSVCMAKILEWLNKPEPQFKLFGAGSSY